MPFPPLGPLNWAALFFVIEDGDTSPHCVKPKASSCWARAKLFVRREKPGQPTEAEGSYIGWPVVALASLGQESGPPNTQLNETQRYATRANTQRYSSLRHTSVRWPTCSGWPNRASAQASAALHIKRGSPTSPATRSTFWTKLTVHQHHEALARRAAGETLVDIARSYAVSHSTISRLH